MLKNKKRTALASVLGAGVALAAVAVAAVPASAAITDWLPTNGSSGLTQIGTTHDLTSTYGLVPGVESSVGNWYLTPTSDIASASSLSVTFTAPEGVIFGSSGSATGATKDNVSLVTGSSCVPSANVLRCTWGGNNLNFAGHTTGNVGSTVNGGYILVNSVKLTVTADAKGSNTSPIVATGSYTDATGTNTIAPVTIGTLDLPQVDDTPVVNPYIAAGGVVAAAAAGGAILVMRRRKVAGQSA